MLTPAYPTAPLARQKFEHIDGLFTKSIDWELNKWHWHWHWQDIMQVMLSIQAGKVLPSMLLLKLNSNNRQNRLYLCIPGIGSSDTNLILVALFLRERFVPLNSR